MRRVTKRQTYPALKEYLSKDRPTQLIDAVAVAVHEADAVLVSAAEVAVVPNPLDLTRITIPAVKKLQTALVTKEFLWAVDTPEANLPTHPEPVDEVVVPDSSVAALFVEVAEEIDIHPSTSTKKAVGNKRYIVHLLK